MPAQTTKTAIPSNDHRFRVILLRPTRSFGLTPLVGRKQTMPVEQGDLGLLQHPASRELLESRIPARLAYIATDGTPRVIPIWFHWNGTEFVMGTPPKAPKLKALAKNPRVALTIDDNSFPHKVLLGRGTGTDGLVDGSHHGHSGLGRAAGFPDALSQCSPPLAESRRRQSRARSEPSSALKHQAARKPGSAPASHAQASPLLSTRPMPGNGKW